MNHHRPVRRNSGYDPQQTIFLPGGRTIVAAGPTRWVGTPRGQHAPSRGNPYRPSGPWRATAAELVLGLKAGAKKPGAAQRWYRSAGARTFAPYERFSVARIEREVLNVREVQTGRPPGFSITPTRGHFQGLREDSLKLSVYPEGESEETDSALFFERVYDLANELAVRFEQDQVIVNLVRGGVQEAFFLNWSDEPVPDAERAEFVRRLRAGEE